MKVTIEDEHSSVTIDNHREEVSAIDAVKLCKVALVALSYHPKTVHQAMEDIGSYE